jgi:deoxyribonuclease (pyrimidine dimer)
VTRINVIDPDELTDQHLLAEYRELPRAVRLALRVRDTAAVLVPTRYTMGTGHVRFFYTRTDWLVDRHTRIVGELQRRGYSPKYVALITPVGPASGWSPDGRDREVNLERLRDRLLSAPWPTFYTFHGVEVQSDFYDRPCDGSSER